MSSPRQDFGRDRRLDLLHLASVLLVIGAYNLATFNRYLPPTEGWFSAYAQRMHAGEIPYRDFYFYLPPLYLWGFSKITAVVGLNFFVLRLLGVGVMLAFASGLWCVLRRHLGRSVATGVAVAGTIYYQTGNAHITYDFIQVMNVAVLWGLVALQESLVETARRNRLILLGLAGLCFAGAALIKQSNGGIIFVFAALAALTAGGRQWRELLAGAGAFSAGAILPVLAGAAWLGAHDALAPAWDQVFSGALASKGAFGPIVGAAWMNAFAEGGWLQCLSVYWVALIAGCWGVVRCGGIARAQPAGFSAALWAAGTVTVVGGAAISLPWMQPALTMRMAAGFRELPWQQYFIPAGLAGMVLALGSGAVAAARHVTEGKVRLVLGLVLCGMIWGNGTSAGFSEAGVFLACAYLVGALLLDGGWLGLVRPLLGVVLAVLVVIWAEEKYARPYAWWGIEEGDVRQARRELAHPLQRGMLVGENTARFFDAMATVGPERPGESMVVFPHLPVFYLLKSARPAGRAVVHWFDFLPDRAAEAELLRWRAVPPTWIAWCELPEEVWTAHERLFRGGRPCGQREMARWLREQAAAGDYEEVAVGAINATSAVHWWRRRGRLASP